MSCGSPAPCATSRTTAPQAETLVEELLRRVRHPSLASHPQALFLRTIAEDIAHNAMRLATAAGDLAASVDRRKQR